MTTVADSTLSPAPQAYEDQELARMLLRRLMAERNLRTSGAAELLGEEPHTVRRMLNGSRAIALSEIVLIARLGGYSLDEIFLQAQRPSAAARQGSSEESLSKVFGAIADLLSGTVAPNPQPAQSISYVPRPSKAAASDSAHGSQRGVATGKRGRGRPRKAVGPDGLPGPQW